MSAQHSCLTFLLLLGGLVGPAVAAPDSDEPESRGPKKGVLFIHGGRVGSGKASYAGFVDLVRQVSSKKTPKVVVITTAGGRRAKGKSDTKSARAFRQLVGKANVSVLYTLSRKVADTQEFTAPIDAADAVWMNGGEQVHLTRTFLGTKTEKSFRALLDRGGVIGGSSAGAQIQSSFMTRGIVKGDRILGTGKHQRGFGFITNTAFDVHVAARKRNNDLFKLFATKPGQLTDRKLNPKTLLGIGIDENTSLIVRQDQFEVVGAGHVYVFNPREWINGRKPFYHTLSAGDRYDVRKRRKQQRQRKINSEESEKRPAAFSSRFSTTEGFYKDIYVDGGYGISSRPTFPAVGSLKRSSEYYSGKNADLQNSILGGNEHDSNGVLLYPDGQPRFRLMYVHGGGTTKHGKSMMGKARTIQNILSMLAILECWTVSLIVFNSTLRPSRRPH